MATLDCMNDDQEFTELLRREAPMNLPRAHELMCQLDLLGMVLGEPVNVFHALGYWPQISRTRAGQPPTTFVLLSRDDSAPCGLVTTRFIYYYTWADARFERRLQSWLYLDADDDPGNQDVLDAVVIKQFANRGAVALSRIEAQRREALAAIVPERRAMRDAGRALVSAMRALGLWRGRIAFDHPVIQAVCVRHDHPGTLVPGDNIVRAIRLVKSPLEIRLMRRAATANAEALTAVGRKIRAGASHHELRRQFDIECAMRGNHSVFLTVDRVSSDLSDERIRDGQCLFIDGVSQFQHYHGDYARSVFVGEPNAIVRRAADAAHLGWSAVRERLKPGLRYSDLVRIGHEAVRKAGFDTAIGFGPHSVGLMHTDEPCDDAHGFYRKADLTLRENMIVSVDCPVMDTGIGGSAHIEDLMLITADGAEPIHPLGDAVVVV